MMKTQKLLIALLTLILTAPIVQAEDKPAEELSSRRRVRGPKTAETVQAEEKTEQELSNTRFAYTDLRITTDPKTFLMGFTDDDTERLSDIMHSPEVLQSAAKDVLGTSDAYGKEQFLHSMVYIPSQIGGLQVIRVKVSVALKKEHKPAAKEFLEAYIKKLRSAFQKEYDFAHKLHGEKLSVYFQRKDRAEMELDHLLSAQSALAGARGKLDKESVRQRILEHEKAKIDNDMQQAILRKRAEELVQQISEANRQKDEKEAIAAKIEALQNEKDRLSAEYTLVEFKRAGLAERADSTAEQEAMTSQLSKLENTVRTIEREIDRLSKREQVLESRTTDEIQELNRELRQTTMQLEKLEIQETILLGYSPGKISDSIEYEMLEVKIEAAKENLRQAILKKDEATLEVDLLQPPTVSYDEIICSETIPEND